MRIAFIETNAITNEVLRAYAGAHRLCIGYPDGVPETWRDAGEDRTRERLDELEYRLAVAFEHIEDLEESARRCAGETRGRTDETRARIAALEARAARLCPTCGNAGGAGGGAAYPEHELDPAALLGPVAEPADWPERGSAGDEEC